jgi:hypothetical protein
VAKQGEKLHDKKNVNGVSGPEIEIDYSNYFRDSIPLNTI